MPREPRFGGVRNKYQHSTLLSPYTFISPASFASAATIFIFVRELLAPSIYIDFACFFGGSRNRTSFNMAPSATSDSLTPSHTTANNKQTKYDQGGIVPDLEKHGDEITRLSSA